MELHRRFTKGELSLDELEHIAKNAGYPISTLYEELSGRRVEVRKCFVCEGRLDFIITALVSKIMEALKEVKINSFVMAVKANSSIELRERSIAEELSIESWESVRREIKREVGKIIQRLSRLKPNFRSPDVVILVDLDNIDVNLILLPLYIKGKYHKLGRYISQMIWISRSGEKKYKLSIEEICKSLTKPVKGKDIKIHAAGREDVDVRMLGSGRPLIVEIKEPKIKKLSLEELSKDLSKTPWVKVTLEDFALPSDVTKIKSAIHQKVYGALVYSPKGFSEEDIVKLSKELRNTLINQLTPLRVLRRRKEMLRVKKVYEVKGILLNKYLAYFIIRCDGGLYVKELINGDKGRTNPSFSSIIGKEINVLFLDVLEYLEM